MRQIEGVIKRPINFCGLDTLLVAEKGCELIGFGESYQRGLRYWEGEIRLPHPIKESKVYEIMERESYKIEVGKILIKSYNKDSSGNVYFEFVGIGEPLWTMKSEKSN